MNHTQTTCLTKYDKNYFALNKPGQITEKQRQHMIIYIQAKTYIVNY